MLGGPSIESDKSVVVACSYRYGLLDDPGEDDEESDANASDFAPRELRDPLWLRRGVLEDEEHEEERDLAALGLYPDVRFPAKKCRICILRSSKFLVLDRPPLMQCKRHFRVVLSTYLLCTLQRPGRLRKWPF